ncbi:MAG TPA: glycoside hydrolase family 172 protein [Ruminiclostridium sp.]
MEIYEKNNKEETHWSSFENPTGGKGIGGMDNRGAKGKASEGLDAGESKTIFNITDGGIINRIWITMSDRSPEILRSLIIQMFWDGSEKPAVSVPLGDFFCAGLGILLPFENELFSSPEGKSFNSYVPMPFYKSALIVIKNESNKAITHFFYDINYIIKNMDKNEAYYFHAYWNRQNSTVLGEDYEILPNIKGEGRFIGTNIGIISNPVYNGSWWGEGEVKIFIDDDKEYPTLVGTGTEDYIGTAWGQGVFNHRYQGCLVSDTSSGSYSFYRLHIKDPIYFNSNCKVTIQQMGGANKEKLIEIRDGGGAIQVISSDSEGNFRKLHEISPGISPDDPSILPGSWLNFYRQDDFSATSYFYLNHPESGLCSLIDCKERIFGLTYKENLEKTL